MYCMYLLHCLYRRPQLYNEDINDLLAPDNQKLAVHETKEAGVYVAGLREDIVASPEQVGGPVVLDWLVGGGFGGWGALGASIGGGPWRWQVAAASSNWECRRTHLRCLLSCSFAASPLSHPTLPPAIAACQVLELLDGGECHRHFGETKMNKNSSRSHTIFRMVVESRSRDANPDDAQVWAGGLVGLVSG
jgi:hypothetical protein